MVNFDPAKDIPDLSNKVIIVTGGNAGLGKETVRILASHNAKAIYMASRTQSKAETAITEIKKDYPNANIHFLPIDLTDFTSISAAAQIFTSQSDRLDILVNNAGIMNGPYSETKQGYEIQFGTNHMGHALLTKLLLPTLLRTAEASTSDVRVVNLSSSAIGLTGLMNGITTSTPSLKGKWTFIRYGNSKLANLLHARGLAERHPQLTATSVHPGFVATNLFSNTQKQGGNGLVDRLFRSVQGWFSTADVGARNQLWAMFGDRREVRKGFYFVPVGKTDFTGNYFGSKKQADRLWEFTEGELEKKGY
ncbi:retinol dehydrogenase 12 [Elsinoe ampelina]|uniref:Retinol dehydrogenase 12 n=1 Tax=Elsinoe ampelina TaxID=302913 RepID=A0A6A6G9E5_9PEZI|nr:retinol dehydrogenase 12 [Elsinoe ampelina]